MDPENLGFHTDPDGQITHRKDKTEDPVMGEY